MRRSVANWSGRQSASGVANNVIQVVLQFKDQASKALESFTGKLGSLGGLLAGFGVAFSLKHVIAEMADASDAIARLGVALKSNAGFVGLSQKSLEAYSQQLERTSTFSDEAVQRGQALLLQFRNIRGEVFLLANQAMVDLAAKMGGDVSGAAQLLGKALQDPIQGMQNLRRAGIILVDSQKEQIKQLIALGDVQGAQKIILQQVADQAGGTAAALRNTLGGSLEALKVSFNNLFEGSPEKVSKFASSVNALSETLRDPALKGAIDTVTGALVTGLSEALKILAGVIDGWKLLFQIISHPPQTPRDALLDKQSNLGANLNAELDRREKLKNPAFGNSLERDANERRIADLRKQISDLQTELQSHPVFKGLTRADNEAAAAAKALQGKLFDVSGDKAALDALEEIRAGVDTKTHTILQRLSEFANAWDATLAGWNDETSTRLEKQIGDFSDFSSKLGELLNAGVIDAETYNTRLREAFRNATPLPNFKTDELADDANKFAEFAEAGKQAARNIQDAFANAFLSIGRGGSNLGQSILDSFRTMWAQMLALSITQAFGLQQIFRAAANDIAGTLKGIFSGKSVSGGDLFSAILGIGSLFFAGGGTSPGGVATVGEGGPEKVFLPRGSKVLSAARTRRETGAGPGGTGGPVTIKITNEYNGLGLTQPQVASMVADGAQALTTQLVQVFQDNGLALR